MHISWSVNLDDQPYKIDLEHGFFTGNRIITVNGVDVHKSRKFFDSGTSEHTFQIGAHSGKIRIRMMFDAVYDLYVDGTPREQQKISTLSLLKTMPLWGWLLVLVISSFALYSSRIASAAARSVFGYSTAFIWVMYLVFAVGIWVVSGNRKFPLWQRLPLSLLLVVIYIQIIQP